MTAAKESRLMIRTEIRDACLVLTLSRPEKANALTREMLEALIAALEAARSEAVKLLILTGEGKVFSAGADLDEVAQGLASDGIWEKLSSAIAEFPGLTIAALNGTLAGGAFGLALACDLRIAVAEAQFFYPVMKRGYLPQAADAERLTALIGPARCRRILLCGERFGSDAALAMGLIEQIAPREDLVATALALAGEAMNASPSHVAAVKAVLPPL